MKHTGNPTTTGRSHGDFELGEELEKVEWGEWGEPARLVRAVLVEAGDGYRVWRTLSSRQLTPLEERIAKNGIEVVMSEQGNAKRKQQAQARREDGR